MSQLYWHRGKATPDFRKKGLSDFTLDANKLLQFDCDCCSTTLEHPFLSENWPTIVEDLDRQLADKPHNWGAGQTLVYSELTEGFSPHLVKQGITNKCLRMVLDRTQFRIRILTKNGVVGASKWIEFFKKYPGRVIVGLSLVDRWTKPLRGTSPKSSRLQALHRLQEAGVPTFGLLCPIFPDVLIGEQLDRLVDAAQPMVVEELWAEPFNDLAAWKEFYGLEHRHRLSRYSADLYVRLRDKADREGWLNKLHYILYDDQILSKDAGQFTGLVGVALQSEPGRDGRSANPAIAALQV